MKRQSNGGNGGNNDSLAGGRAADKESSNLVCLVVQVTARGPCEGQASAIKCTAAAKSYDSENPMVALKETSWWTESVSRRARSC